MTLNKAWMTLRNRSFADYVRGVDNFLSFAFSNVKEEDRETVTIRCPCDKCRNIFFKKKCEVRLHLIKWGMYESYTIWEFHRETLDTIEENANETDVVAADDDFAFSMLQDACGVAGMDLEEDEHLNTDEPSPEEPNENAKKFYRLLKEYQDPLTVDGAKMSKLSYIVKLLHLKVLNNWSDNSFDSLLKLQREALGVAVPSSYYEAKKLIKDLGLDYIKIDACQNDCIIYWKENENLNECPTCGLSRWKTVDTVSGKGCKVPHKVLRHFPLKGRLQRLYMSRKTAKDMQWHKLERVDDKIMRHPADSDAWKSFDKDYGEFSTDPRNVRLGLASDGFQPFNNSQHSIWPVVLIPYNLPPWLCMKPHSFMLTLLIPGPTSPGRNIDVYLQPLIEELKELWEVGIETYDAYSKENFKLHAAVLWTINDFPAYGDLSGWSTKGHFACPCCHKDTKRTSLLSKGGYLKHRRWLPLSHKWRNDARLFDNTKEKGHAPTPLKGDDVLEHFKRFTAEKFGKTACKKRKKKDSSNSLYGWHKKSIFFALPYWRKLKIRHNLDVMHIEKNVSDSILGTLMNIKGKHKDTLKARLDLVKMKVRDELHPVLNDDKVHVPVACYTLSSTAKAAICDMIANLKSPDGYLSNISRCVKDNGKKISCMKSHDHHVFIEQLLPLAVRGFLPNQVYEPLVELCSYFKNLCSKSITVEQLETLEKNIPYTLCKLEMIFPPAFFDVMVHLVIHLATEAKIAGPVCYRWMYPVERYLRTLKAYVRNRSHPEGSIAEGYLADECLTFCSRYLVNECGRVVRTKARHLVNECGRVVRTKAPLNVKNWQEAFLVAGEGMWKEIQDKFQIVDSGKDLKMYAFVVDTMQRLYRLWKCRLHYYYKSPKCGKTDQERLKNPPPDLPINQWTYCVNHYASPEFKLVSERNSKNRLYANRCKHTTGNLAFAEVEDILTKNNNNVKPSADVIWMLQHTHCNDQGELEWADGTRSKEIHDKLKDVVAVAGNSMTQEEILIEVLDSRSGYICGKGTALRSYSRGKQQLEQRKLVQIQQEKIQEQEHRIKELEDSQRKQQQELEDNQQKQHQELEEYKRQQQEAMDAFKKDLLQQLASRGI